MATRKINTFIEHLIREEEEEEEKKKDEPASKEIDTEESEEEPEEEELVGSYGSREISPDGINIIKSLRMK